MHILRDPLRDHAQWHASDAQPVGEKAGGHADGYVFLRRRGTTPEEAEYTALDTTDLEAGEYVLTVTLTDRHADQRVSTSVNFLVLEP